MTLKETLDKDGEVLRSVWQPLLINTNKLVARPTKFMVDNDVFVKVLDYVSRAKFGIHRTCAEKCLLSLTE